jgi:hypothetical protein
MPHGSDERPSSTPQTAAELRTEATRARRLAREILDPPAKAELIAFAEEREARAAALETAPQTVSHPGTAAAQPPDPAEEREARIAAMRPPTPGKSEPQTE